MKRTTERGLGMLAVYFHTSDFFFKPQVEKVDIEDRRGYFSSSKANCI